MVMPCSILFCLYFASLLEDIAEAKLPPRPTLCSQDILKRTTRCREAESINLLQLLPTDPSTFVLGIFLGHLLRICNAAERLTNCDYLLTITGCQLPREWNTHVIDEPIKLLAELCKDPQIFEIQKSMKESPETAKSSYTEYTELTNCVSHRTRYINQCYGRRFPVDKRHARINCSTSRIIARCVERQINSQCSASHILALANSLVAIGLRSQVSRCNPARRNVDSLIRRADERNGAIHTKLDRTELHNSAGQRGVRKHSVLFSLLVLGATMLVYLEARKLDLLDLRIT